MFPRKNFIRLRENPPDHMPPPPGGFIDAYFDPETGKVHAKNSDGEDVFFNAVVDSGDVPTLPPATFEGPGTYEIPDDLYLLFVDASEGDVGVTLPDPASRVGKPPLTIIRLDDAGGNSVAVNGPVNGQSAMPMLNQYASMSLRVNGTTFIIIASNNLSV